MERFIPRYLLAIINRTIQKGIRLVSLKNTRNDTLEVQNNWERNISRSLATMYGILKKYIKMLQAKEQMTESMIKAAKYSKTANIPTKKKLLHRPELQPCDLCNQLLPWQDCKGQKYQLLDKP